MSLPDDFEVRVGDVLEELKKLPDACVQTCVTSPPYWGLRDYGVDGQLGLEPTPKLYAEHMAVVFRQVRRVLRDDGTLWLNLGDSYAGSWGAQGRSGGVSDRSHISAQQIAAAQRRESGTGSTAHLDLKPKDMVGIPWRVAFALQQDGWWLRSDIIWHKPNPMPESVTDRPTSSHEHIFLLAKSRRYYYDNDAVRVPYSETSKGRYDYPIQNTGGQIGRHQPGHDGRRPEAERIGMNEKGRNRRDVWTVTTRPFPDAHFAVYPPDLIMPCVKAGTSQRGQCTECGAPWEREVERGSDPRAIAVDDRPARANVDPGNAPKKPGSFGNGRPARGEEWTPTCDCDADTEPQLVLDPFCGAGTTGVVCTELGRRFLGIELNPEYAEMAERRIMGTNPTLFRGTV